MKPGVELDKLVHEKVMDGEGMAPPYSTDIEWAWKVMENCYEGGEIIGLGRDLDGQYVVGISHWTNGGEYGPRIWDDTLHEPSYKCPTAPHAICIAAVAFYLDDCGESLEWEEPEVTRLREIINEKTDETMEKPTRSGPED